jgi:hypothetical protein
MKSFLLGVLLIVVLGGVAYFGFPVWYLNESPRVLIQPHSLVSRDRPANEEMSGKAEEPSPHPQAAKETTQLMYLDQALETRLAAGFGQMKLTLPVLKIGIGSDADYHVASIEFFIGDSPQQAVLERETIEIAYTAYRMVPDLTEIDVYGVDHPDLKDHRGRQLYTVNITRDSLWAANPRLSRHDQVAQLGRPWYSPVLLAPAAAP